MRILPAVFFASLLSLSLPVTHAQVMEENECLLQYLKSVQSNRAVAMINGACNYLSTWSSSMELHHKEREYNECLLKELSGVQNDQAATLVGQACYRLVYNTLR